MASGKCLAKSRALSVAAGAWCGRVRKKTPTQNTPSTKKQVRSNHGISDCFGIFRLGMKPWAAQNKNPIHNLCDRDPIRSTKYLRRACSVFSVFSQQSRRRSTSTSRFPPAQRAVVRSILVLIVHERSGQIDYIYSRDT